MVIKWLVLSFLLSSVLTIKGASVPDLSECSKHYISSIENNNSIEENDRCELMISAEVVKFYDKIHKWIENGVNAESLDNSNFVDHELCIINNLRHFNVTDLYLKGIAYQSLNSVYDADYSVKLILKSKQILLNALQLCEPKTLYARYAERIMNVNMRITNVQANCLLNHVNENSVHEPYQFVNNTEPSDSLDSKECFEVVKLFIRKYYNVLDMARSVPIFGLNPSKVLRCREDRDKSYIDNMILLAIFRRLSLTPEQRDVETNRYFEIARDEARNFFHCMPMYE